MNKRITLFFLLFLSICSLAQTPQVSIPITINDGAGGFQVLHFGLDPSATDELDGTLGEEPLPPMPPITVFDARLNLPNGTESSFKDFRLGSNSFSGTKEYKLQYQAGTGSVINIIWNFMPGVTGLLQDLFGGVIVNIIMSESGSYQVTNPGALDKLKMIITYTQPTLIYPPNRAENIPLTPTLSWNTLASATKYGLYVATESDFNNLVYSDTTITQTTKTLTNSLSAYATYYWRVTGINANGRVIYSEGRNFKTIRSISWVNLQWPESVVITQGENMTAYSRIQIEGVTGVPGPGAGISGWIGYSALNTSPDTWINWVPATYNQDYGNNDEFMASFGSTLALGTYYYASRFQYNEGVYSYGGYNQGGGGFWDGISNVSGELTVESQLPGVPDLISPPDNSVNVSILPTLIWSTPSNANIYRLQISSDPGFSSMVLNDSTITDTSNTLLTPLQKNTKYYWRVSSKNSAGTSAFSTIWNFTTGDTMTSVERENTIEEYSLEQNYPNPFNPSTIISYQIPSRSYVTLKVYDMIGNEMTTLINMEQEAGIHYVEFNAQEFTSGVYLYAIAAGDYYCVRKMALVR